MEEPGLSVRGLTHLGTYGRDKIRLYRNNQQCFLLIPGKGTNGVVTSIILWNPKYNKVIVAFPSATTAEAAMGLVYRSIRDKRQGIVKQTTYRSKSVLYVNGRPYPLYGTKTAVAKYPFLVTRFNQSLRSTFLVSSIVKIMYKDPNPQIGNESVVYHLGGIAQALSAYNSQCN